MNFICTAMHEVLLNYVASVTGESNRDAKHHGNLTRQAGKLEEKVIDVYNHLSRQSFFRIFLTTFHARKLQTTY